MKIYIGIQSEGKTYYPLLIGYSSDGGFWIKDLFLKQARGHISKMRIPINSPTDRMVTIPVNKRAEWITDLNPKLTHHTDGTAHVSGEGIISGFYKIIRRAKGVYVKSMNLFRNDNDGGPIFVFSCWGLNDFGSTSAHTSQNVVFGQEEIRNYHIKNEGRPDYCIEGFYISKALEKWIDPVTRIFIKQHPLFGDLPLKVLPAPERSPGYIGVACFKTFTQSKEPSGFSLTGGPGYTDETGHFENIAIVKPTDRKFADRKSIRMLDLDLLKLRQFIFKTDRHFADIIEKLKIKSKGITKSIRDDILKISPVKIKKFRLGLLVRKKYISPRRFIKISRIISSLIDIKDVERYRALYFYTGAASNLLSKETIASLFRELSQNVNTPMFANPRRQVENATNRICSLERFRIEFAKFLSDHGFSGKTDDKIIDMEDALRKIIVKHPLVVLDIPEALPGTNIKWFFISPYAYIMGPFPSALYSTTQLFSSHAPLAFTVEGSIRERSLAEVPEYRHLAI